ncbi:MAG: hypothetical protein WCG93_01825 [Paludibacter sp.]
MKFLQILHRKAYTVVNIHLKFHQNVCYATNIICKIGAKVKDEQNILVNVTLTNLKDEQNILTNDTLTKMNDEQNILVNVTLTKMKDEQNILTNDTLTKMKDEQNILYF